MSNQSTLLKVVSILYLVFAGITAIFLVIGLTAALALTALGLDFLYVISLIISVALIVVGIIASINGIKQTDANLCKKLGIIFLAMAVINLIVGFIAAGFNFMSLISLILPVLYLIGANQLKEA